MTTQTMLTTLGAAILLVFIAVAMYAMTRPGIPNTGSDADQSAPLSTSSDVLIDDNPNANLNDDMISPVPENHSE